MAKKQPDLIIESHPDDYTGLPFLTLVKFHEEHLLCIVDNIDLKTIRAYVIDYCQSCDVDENVLLNLANDWWHDVDMKMIPFSFYVSKKGFAVQLSPVYREFTISHVMRIVGPVPYYEMVELSGIKKRKKSKATANALSNVVSFT